MLRAPGHVDSTVSRALCTVADRPCGLCTVQTETDRALNVCPRYYPFVLITLGEPVARLRLLGSVGVRRAVALLSTLHSTGTGLLWSRVVSRLCAPQQSTSASSSHNGLFIARSLIEGFRGTFLIKGIRCGTFLIRLRRAPCNSATSGHIKSRPCHGLVSGRATLGLRPASCAPHHRGSDLARCESPPPDLPRAAHPHRARRRRRRALA